MSTRVAAGSYGWLAPLVAALADEPPVAPNSGLVAVPAGLALIRATIYNGWQFIGRFAAQMPSAAVDPSTLLLPERWGRVPEASGICRPRSLPKPDSDNRRFCSLARRVASNYLGGIDFVTVL
jgi:hypothetical protein